MAAGRGGQGKVEPRGPVGHSTAPGQSRGLGLNKYVRTGSGTVATPLFASAQIQQCKTLLEQIGVQPDETRAEPDQIAG